jgi:hypothetical protein
MTTVREDGRLFLFMVVCVGMEIALTKEKVVVCCSFCSL